MNLNVEHLSVSYGAIKAVKDISFTVSEGEIVTLIGSNGAGKTTIMRAITGLEKTESGSILFGDTDLTKTPAHKIVAKGIAHVPEGRRVFTNLSVMDNLKMGATLRKDKSAIKEDLEHVFETFPRLYERQSQMAATLSGGEQQMLAVGRALMAHSSMILLDEPSMGLAPLVVEEIFEVIKRANTKGITILLVEQNAFMALQVAHRAYVLETGSIVKEGTGKELLRDQSIIDAYLGT